MATGKQPVLFHYTGMSEETLEKLKSYASPAATTEDIAARQVVIADACVSLHNSVVSVVKMIQAIENVRP